MKNSFAAVVVFYDSNQRILMHKRTSVPEEWGYIGGSIEPGEDPLGAAKREVAEELGYVLHDVNFLKKYDDLYKSGSKVTVHTFIAPFPGFDKFQATAEGDIREDLRLVTLEEARALPTFSIAYDIMKDISNFLRKKT